MLLVIQAFGQKLCLEQFNKRFYIFLTFFIVWRHKILYIILILKCFMEHTPTPSPKCSLCFIDVRFYLEVVLFVRLCSLQFVLSKLWLFLDRFCSCLNLYKFLLSFQVSLFELVFIKNKLPWRWLYNVSYFCRNFFNIESIHPTDKFNIEFIRQSLYLNSSHRILKHILVHGRYHDAWSSTYVPCSKYIGKQIVCQPIYHFCHCVGWERSNYDKICKFHSLF